MKIKFQDDRISFWKKNEYRSGAMIYSLNTFITSYGTFIWFKYDALKFPFDIELKDEDIPEEPPTQRYNNTISLSAFGSFSLVAVDLTMLVSSK